MARLTKQLMNRALGYRDPAEEGLRRSLRGLREGDQRELYIGLALAALAYLRRSEPRRELLFRKSVPVGSALVIHHKRRGDPRIQVVKPEDL